MARAAVHGVQVVDQPARKSARDKSGARQFGPYGVSFNGQDPDGNAGQGPDLRAPLDATGGPSLPRDPLGDQDGGHRQ